MIFGIFLYVLDNGLNFGFSFLALRLEVAVFLFEEVIGAGEARDAVTALVFFYGDTISNSYDLWTGFRKCKRAFCTQYINSQTYFYGLNKFSYFETIFLLFLFHFIYQQKTLPNFYFVEITN